MSFKGGRSIKITQHAWEDDQSRVINTVEDLIDGEISRTDKNLRLYVEPWEDKRTDAQNRFMWPMVREIGQHVGASDQAMLNHLLDARYGKRTEVVCGVEMRVYPKTSEFTKPIMVDFLEFCKGWAAQEHGLSVMMPKDYGLWASEARKRNEC